MFNIFNKIAKQIATAIKRNLTPEMSLGKLLNNMEKTDVKFKQEKAIIRDLKKLAKAEEKAERKEAKCREKDNIRGNNRYDKRTGMGRNGST